MVQQNFSADKSGKLEDEFAKTMSPSASSCAQLAKETGLTEKQVKQCFDDQRKLWKFCFDAFLDGQCTIEKNENALQKYNAKRQNIAVAQLDKLEEIFGAQKYLSVGDMKKYATEIGLTDNQVEEWFEKRRLEWELKQRKREPIDAKIVAAIQKVMEDEQNAKENAKNEEWFNERRSQWKWKYLKCDFQNKKLPPPPIYDKIFVAVQKVLKEEHYAKAEVKDKEYYKRRAKKYREEAKKRQQKRVEREKAQQQNLSADQLDKLEREFEKRNEKMAKEIGLTETQVKEWFEYRRRQWINNTFSSDCGLKKQQSAQNVVKTEAIEQKNIKVEQNSQQNGVDDIAQKQNLSADKLDKLELKFGTTKCPNASDCAQLAMETGLTEKQVEERFHGRISQGRRIGETLNKIPRQRTEFKHYQLRKLKNAFVENHFPDIFMIKELAKETDLTEEQIEKWFKNAQAKYSRHNNKEHQSLMMLKQNTSVVGAKVCIECGQRIVHQTVPPIQSQPNANVIGSNSVGCTSVSAVRGRAKCRRLFWRAVTFPMNAVAKFVKKVRSAKGALANKGKKEKK
ncbi:hypothetical protein niasHT_026369 [Heterodera trifolii]|uniref:Homeobox domain-containing protein n=1 Tax=Heterodera trifolii TaxID=157864 RepID=A0ABD2KR80_9BILA